MKLNVINFFFKKNKQFSSFYAILCHFLTFLFPVIMFVHFLSLVRNSNYSKRVFLLSQSVYALKKMLIFHKYHQ